MDPVLQPATHFLVPCTGYLHSLPLVAQLKAMYSWHRHSGSFPLLLLLDFHFVDRDL